MFFFYGGRGGGPDAFFPILMLFLFIVLNVVMRSRWGGRRFRSRRAVEVDWSAVNDPELQALLASQQLVRASERYSELTGCDWREARFAINTVLNQTAKKKKTTYDVPDAGIRDLVKEGNIEQAVEVYRLFAGVDEYTARDAIAAMEREIRLSDSPAPDSETADAPNETTLRDLLHPE